MTWLRSGMWAALFTLPQLLAVWLVYLVFFWDRIGDLLREFGFAVPPSELHQTIQFKSAVKQQRKKAQQQGYRHKCEVCRPHRYGLSRTCSSAIAPSARATTASVRTTSSTTHILRSERFRGLRPSGRGPLF